jgi:small subunit ribosomal protein S20
MDESAFASGWCSQVSGLYGRAFEKVPDGKMMRGFAETGWLCIFAPRFQNTMANHKSALKRIRTNDAKRLRNRYYHKTTRNAVRKLRSLTSKAEAEALLPKVASMLDKLAKRDVIHFNKASNLKSSLTVFVNKLK